MSLVSQALSTTSYALLGLLGFDDSDDGVTGYQLKQRADFTLRFYWSSPAMSQIYSELGRLSGAELVAETSVRSGHRTSRRYRLTELGVETLNEWLASTEPDFPALKHPVALRLLMGHRMQPEDVTRMLQTYERQLADRRADLEQVRAMLGDAEATRFPALVADWGLAYYDSESAAVQRTIAALDD